LHTLVRRVSRTASWQEKPAHQSLLRKSFQQLGEETLKTAVVKSLDRLVQQVTRSPADGFTLMSILDVIARVLDRYGCMQQDTKASLDERMALRLTSMDTLDTHLANLTDNFEISAIGMFPIAEEKRAKLFRESMLGHQMIAKTLEAFDLLNKDSRTHTFGAITSYVVDNLPNLQAAFRLATKAEAHIMASEVYLSLAAENKQLKAALPPPKPTQKKCQRKKGNKFEGRKNDSKKSKLGVDTSKPLHYCHAHGEQNTHPSSECKLMAAATERFNAAM
jgi:hypothetical protein